MPHQKPVWARSTTCSQVAVHLARVLSSVMCFWLGVSINMSILVQEIYPQGEILKMSSLWFQELNAFI